MRTKPQDLRRNPYVGTQPPLDPRHGDEWILPADTTNGIMWRFRFNANSPGIFKWESVGGNAPMEANIDTGESCSSGSFVDLATVLSLVAPRYGDYEAEWGSRRFDMPTVNTGPAMSLDWPAKAAAYDGLCTVAVGQTSNTVMSCHTKRAVTLKAGDTLKVKYAANSGNPHTVYYRYLMLTPIRLS